MNRQIVRENAIDLNRIYIFYNELYFIILLSHIRSICEKVRCGDFDAFTLFRPAAAKCEQLNFGMPHVSLSASICIIVHLAST
jgi:hypothetical protein